MSCEKLAKKAAGKSPDGLLCAETALGLHIVHTNSGALEKPPGLQECNLLPKSRAWNSFRAAYDKDKELYFSRLENSGASSLDFVQTFCLGKELSPQKGGKARCKWSLACQCPED